MNAIRFSTQGKFLATGGADRKVKLWKEEGGKADLVGTLTGDVSSVNDQISVISIVFAPFA